MLIDATILFNEIALLDLRLRELYDLVDRFVVVEAGQTFSGDPKPIYTHHFRDQLFDPQNKLRFVTLGKLPPIYEDTEAARFRLERFQRDAILFGLLDCNPSPRDYVLVSDVDEIPSRSAVERFLQSDASAVPCLFSQLFLKFHFDAICHDGYHGREWGGTVGVRYAQFAYASPQEVRREVGGAGSLLDRDAATRRGVEIFDDGGFHLSSFGGVALRDYKLGHYAHGAGGPGRPLDHDLGLAMLPDSREAFAPHANSFDLRMVVERTEAQIGRALPETVRSEPERYFGFFEGPGEASRGGA